MKTETTASGGRAMSTASRGRASGVDARERMPLRPRGVLVDALGERLAFSQTCAALYQALASRAPARPARLALERMRDDALRHRDIAWSALRDRGENPIVTSPLTEVAALSCSGMVAVVRDPSSSFESCVTALLVLALGNEDGWSRIGPLASAAGDERLHALVRIARFESHGHAEALRAWVDAEVSRRVRESEDEPPAPSGPRARAH